MICTLSLSCLFLHLHSQSPELICISRFCFYFSSWMKCNRNQVFTRDLTYLNFYHKILLCCFINRKYFSMNKTVYFRFLKFLSWLQLNEKWTSHCLTERQRARISWKKMERLCVYSWITLDQRCMSAELSPWLRHTVLLPVLSTVLHSSGTPVQLFSWLICWSTFMLFLWLLWLLWCLHAKACCGIENALQWVL